MDGVNDYTCKCPGDFGGKFCEVAPMVALMYPQTSPCQHHECRNGICLTPPGAQDYICRCSPGYSGKRCEYLTTISFLHNASFAELEPLRTKPEANITLVGGVFLLSLVGIRTIGKGKYLPTYIHCDCAKIDY